MYMYMRVCTRDKLHNVSGLDLVHVHLNIISQAIGIHSHLSFKFLYN